MTSISIIGIGKMGGAIAGIASASGADVQVVARDVAKAEQLAAGSGAAVAALGEPLTGEIVVLAVPFAALDEVLESYGDQLAGKVVVDITNPVDFSTFDGLVVPSDSSAAAVIAERVPAARVVKAFNTTFAAALATGSMGQAPTTVLVAGDDQAAKDAVIGFVRAGGLSAEDTGSLKRARELEGIGFLQMTLAVTEKIGWSGGLALSK
ncbi:NADPH-dependent F420 reductase [Homoserinibacter sp. GY 40078]|uniref:NADPH-dependent F420 reductase n=1 Tax=Homoserinibacter sp. GY 40078 TaxID=2603275 RepID=UPI0011CA0E70|nr:NADPH-dependent F420 reductase [Homoserinibacter sp. GY 40078]TXK17193.1 NADPH-dependent F420 reductase [Homoserinibacter sp. GY 40078]